MVGREQRRWIVGVATVGAFVALVVGIPVSNGKYTGTAIDASSFTSGALLAPGSPSCAWTGANSLDLSWTDSSPTVTGGYTYQRSNTSGSGFATLGTTTGAASTTGTDPNPAPTTLRYYRVLATSGSWSSSASAEVVSNQCDGTITSIAAAGTFSAPFGVAVDAAGNVYTSASGQVRVYRTTPAGTTTVYAGNGSTNYTGDGGPATSAALNTPLGIGFDSAGNLYIADSGNHVIRRVSTGGTITTYAGNGLSGYSGDGGAATSARLNSPASIAFDSSGNGYIADRGNHVVRRVSAGGTITTFAGTGLAGFLGDGGAATSARLDTPYGVVVDTAGAVFIADTFNDRIRKVTGGVITTVAGGGATSTCSFSGPATSVALAGPRRLAVGPTNHVYIADFDNHCVRVLNGSTISRVTGNGGAGYTGDNGPASSATVNLPAAVAVSSAGDLYIADNANNVTRKVSQVQV